MLVWYESEFLVCDFGIYVIGIVFVGVFIVKLDYINWIIFDSDILFKC